MWPTQLPTYILLKKYKHWLTLPLYSMANDNIKIHNIYNHYPKDEWFPIYIAEVIDFTVERAPWKLQKMSLS